MVYVRVHMHFYTKALKKWMHVNQNNDINSPTVYDLTVIS